MVAEAVKAASKGCMTLYDSILNLVRESKEWEGTAAELIETLGNSKGAWSRRTHCFVRQLKNDALVARFASAHIIVADGSRTKARRPLVITYQSAAPGNQACKRTGIATAEGGSL